MTPRVSLLTQAFLSTVGRRINPAILRKCWPQRHDIVPRQPTSEIQARITHCLDQVAHDPLRTLLGIFSCGRTLTKIAGGRTAFPIPQDPLWT